MRHVAAAHLGIVGGEGAPLCRQAQDSEARNRSAVRLGCWPLVARERYEAALRELAIAMPR